MLRVLLYLLRRLRSMLRRLRIAMRSRGPRHLMSRLSRTPAGPHPAAAIATNKHGPIDSSRERILVIDTRTPRPDRDSGSVRALRILGLLVGAGYAVDFMPDDGRPDAQYDGELQRIGVNPTHCRSAVARALWLSAHAHRYVAIIVSRYHLAEALFPLLREVAPGARLILDTVDLHHLREQREAEQKGDDVLLRLARSTRRRELAAIASADVTWVVSDAEVRLIADALPRARVGTVSNIQDPVEYVPGVSHRQGALFVGGAGHPPNVDAVKWLLESLLPAMREAVPALELHLVGEGLKELGLPLPPGVTVHGHVPDLEPLLCSVRIALAPLRFGAGVKGKVNLGLAYGLPMILSSCAAEGMDIVDGVQAFIADTPKAFAQAAALVLLDDVLWARMSDAARAHASARFSVSHAAQAILESLPPRSRY